MNIKDAIIGYSVIAAENVVSYRRGRIVVTLSGFRTARVPAGYTAIPDDWALIYPKDESAVIYWLRLETMKAARTTSSVKKSTA